MALKAKAYKMRILGCLFFVRTLQFNRSRGQVAYVDVTDHFYLRDVTPSTWMPLLVLWQVHSGPYNSSHTAVYPLAILILTFVGIDVITFVCHSLLSICNDIDIMLMSGIFPESLVLTYVDSQFMRSTANGCDQLKSIPDMSEQNQISGNSIRLFCNTTY